MSNDRSTIINEENTRTGLRYTNEDTERPLVKFHTIIFDLLQYLLFLQRKRNLNYLDDDEKNNNNYLCHICHFHDIVW